jgi:hypothetical protein
MAHVVWVAANLESQAVFGADEILRAGHSDEVLAAKLLKNGLRYSEISHFSSVSGGRNHMSFGNW